MLIVVFAFIGSVTWWLAEQYAGGVAANYIISPLTGFLVSSYQWGKEHPGQISMTIFFLTCAYLVIRVIQDIRPVRAIPVTVEYQSAKWGVIKISNHTGDDLFNWTVHVVGLDDAELQSRHLNWFHEGQERDIQNGKSGLIYLQDIRPSLITGRDQEGKPLFDGKVHDVELFFRGNTMKRETLSIRIWIPAKVEAAEKNESDNPVHMVLFSGKVETAPPAFG